MTTQFDPTDPTRFEQMYRDDRLSNGLPAATPWDIGGPQPVVQQLVALGAIKGEVLDPGTGPGHHAIYYASKGYSATGIDGSERAVQRARENARIKAEAAAQARASESLHAMRSCRAGLKNFASSRSSRALSSFAVILGRGRSRPTKRPEVSEMTRSTREPVSR